MELANAFKRFRKDFNLSQQQVADSAGMRVNVYQRYEWGMREPAYKQLRKLADAYNVSIDYLVGRTDNPQISR